MADRDIDLRNLLPRGGSVREAFEEMCFLLFVREFQQRGKVIRRDGTGGDGGLEAYLANKAGAVEVGLQAKRFDSRIGQSQWRQIGHSVSTALDANKCDGALAHYVICTDRNFTESERRKWDARVVEWAQAAAAMGYQHNIRFEHWDASHLLSKLLNPENHGARVYFFDVPNFTFQQLWHTSQITLGNLSERYLPNLHAQTTTETRLYWFVKSAWALNEFHKTVAEKIGRELHRPWQHKRDWSPEAKPLVAQAHSCLDSMLDELGNGCSWPESIVELQSKIEAFNTSMRRLSERRRDELSVDASQSNGPPRDVWQAVQDETGYVEGVYLGPELEHVDRQCLLVLGEAGQGKSHLLAHLATEFVQAKGAVLFLDGGRFTTSEQPWQQLLSIIGFDRSLRDFLSALETMSATTLLPALICIDALNETPDRNVWQRHLLSFAAELRYYRRIKLVVSCRSDFADLTLPSQLTDGAETTTWSQIRHHGLDLDIHRAIERYFNAFSVVGMPSQCFQEEFRNPLFLRLVSEAYSGATIPIGSLTLTTVLDRYIRKKATSIEQRVDVSSTRVIEAIRALAEIICKRNHPQMPENDVRHIFSEFHSTANESRSLYRALISEGILHETRFKPRDGLGYRVEIRFAYERLWDYFISLHLWPSDSPLPTALLDNLRDKSWCRRFRGAMRVLAMRIPEAELGEIHDVLGVAPTHETSSLNVALIDSLNWRNSASCSPRTRELLRAIVAVENRSPYELLLRWAIHIEHPWNSEFLHRSLMAFPGGIGARDRDWTLWLNEQLAWQRQEFFGIQLITLAEQANADRLSDQQADLLGTSLAWMLATTHVRARRRIAHALARLLKGRLSVACQLVDRFGRVDDPYVLSGVLFACAAAAHISPDGDLQLPRLAQSVDQLVFRDGGVSPNFHVRYFAASLCECAWKKSPWKGDLLPESFRPPFVSTWPRIQSQLEFEQWEQQIKSGVLNAPTWRAVLDSSYPNVDCRYGDWGRYEMERATSVFQNRRKNQKRAKAYHREDRFDPRIVQRYVIQRAIELGLDPDKSDETSSGYNGRDRPRVERLGKKYQRIALSEVLAYLADNYHLRDGGDSGGLLPRELHLEDLYDTGVMSTYTQSRTEDAYLVPRNLPWWRMYRDPLTARRSDSGRMEYATSASVQTPADSFCSNDGSVDWVTLYFHFEFVEPRPNYLSAPCHAGPRARLHWSAQSYLVPNSKCALFEQMICKKEIAGSYIPMGNDIREGLGLLSDYPEISRLPGGSHYGIPEGFTVTDSSFTTCWYKSGHEDDALTGEIPSPQLARLGDLRWQGTGLQFGSPSSNKPVYVYVEDELCRSSLIRWDELSDILRKSHQTLYWRVYGWKWIEESNRQTDPTPSSREYVAVFRLHADRKAKCVWGLSWIPGFGGDEQIDWQGAQ